MIIVTKEKELINSEYVVKFTKLDSTNENTTCLVATMSNGSEIIVYESNSENVSVAMENLIEAFTTTALLIDYSGVKDEH